MANANTLTDEETRDGFRLLFDGQSTAGWRGFGQSAIHPQWAVTGDALMFHPGDKPEYGHDIITVDRFTSSELRIEWKLWEVGNRGIMYHVHEDDSAPYMSGPEFQLLDNHRHGDARNGADRHTGACYGLYPPAEDVNSPIGTWNRVRIIVDGDHVEHVMNERSLCTYTLGSEDWNARVAKTKFAEFPRYATRRDGHICLQDHRDPVAVRNIRIRTW